LLKSPLKYIGEWLKRWWFGCIYATTPPPY